MARKVIGIITPCFNEEVNVAACHEAVKTLFEAKLPGYDREHIFADNASTDGTVGALREIAKSDPQVKVIVNARNYGPFRSTFNALLSASGDAVVVMLPVDLQDPPEVIEAFVRHWEEGHEVVYGIRANRKEGLTMRIFRKIYYRLVSRFANITVPPDVGEFQLIDRVVVEALRRCDDYYPYIRGLIANCGFRSTGVPYTWQERARGMSKNRLYHLIDHERAHAGMLVDGVRFIELEHRLRGLHRSHQSDSLSAASPAGHSDVDHRSLFLFRRAAVLSGNSGRIHRSRSFSSEAPPTRGRTREDQLRRHVEGRLNAPHSSDPPRNDRSHGGREKMTPAGTLFDSRALRAAGKAFPRPACNRFL
jgi:hypothetical protein